MLIGEFHSGVPENGLGAGLVQTRDQIERAKGYRYYVELAAAMPGFLGAHLARRTVDVTDRPYPRLAGAAAATHKRLFGVHSGKTAPFKDRPKASDAGTPPSPWTP